MTPPEMTETLKRAEARFRAGARAEAVAPQHSRASLAQLHRADEHIWARLTELAPATCGIRPRPDGARPHGRPGGEGAKQTKSWYKAAQGR